MTVTDDDVLVPASNTVKKIFQSAFNSLSKSIFLALAAVLFYLQEERYEQLHKELQNSKESDWELKGPPNKRYEQIQLTTLYNS